MAARVLDGRPGRPSMTAALSGLGFGLTSGVLTTLGLMVGLNAGTSSRAAVAAGIATIAVADAFSDALGVRVSHEAVGAGRQPAFIAAAATFLAKMLFALSFLVPVLLFELDVAVWLSVGWGLGLIFAFNWSVARRRGGRAWLSGLENAVTALAVLAASQAAGSIVGRWT